MSRAILFPEDLDRRAVLIEELLRYTREVRIGDRFTRIRVETILE
jgi:hypothetical protein